MGSERKYFGFLIVESNESNNFVLYENPDLLLDHSIRGYDLDQRNVIRGRILQNPVNEEIARELSSNLL